MSVEEELRVLANPAKANILAGFFRTGRGEYDEGDVFLGVSVPEQRKVADKYAAAKMKEISRLLHSGIHEYRLTALLILVKKYQNADEQEKRRIVSFYIRNMSQVNNWDLVDLTAPNILGDYIADKDKKILYRLAKSRNLWARRVAIVATLAFIRRGELRDTFALCGRLLNYKHGLIHKACGWMLREAGKRDERALNDFLTKHRAAMPRTMLRYAIERMSLRKRKIYMKK